MRFAVVEAIYQAALKNKKIYFLTGDLDHANVDGFKQNIPNQYINVGIAEQNMVGIASGLALSGMKVFVYSIVPFITMRCYEQIRVDLCYQNVDVVVIGVGAGFAYGVAGSTHHATEDLGIMRVLPNMKIYSPSNPAEAKILTEFLIKNKGPAYLRIGRGKEETPGKYVPIVPQKASVVIEGDKITIFATGTILSEAVSASQILAKEGIRVEVVNIHTIKPLDRDFIIDRIARRKAIFTLEEHNIIGGLGGAISEVIAENIEKHPIIFKRLGVPDTFAKKIGSQKFLRDYFSISAPSIVKTIKQLLNNN